MSDGRTHDVLYVATMGNHLWAFDANTGTPIWSAPAFLGVAFEPKVTSAPNGHRSTSIDAWGINNRWGV